MKSESGCNRVNHVDRVEFMKEPASEMSKSTSFPHRVLRQLTGWIAATLIISFAVGLVIALVEITAHRYLSYGLLPLSLQIAVRNWELAARRLSQFLIGFAFLHIAWTVAEHWIGQKIITIRIVDRDRLLGFTFSLFCAAALFFRQSYSAVMGESLPIRGPRIFLDSMGRFLEELAQLDSSTRLLVPASIAVAIFFAGGFLASRLRLGSLAWSVGRLSSSRGAIVLASLALLLFVGAAVAENRLMSAGSGKKNIILISIDTLRTQNLGCYGYGRDTSPSIDSFSKRSAFFRNAYAAWPKTTPSVTALMTGLYPHTSGIMRLAPYQYLDDELLVLAEILRNSGYYTEGIIANGVIGIETNGHQGFDRFVEKAGNAEIVTRAALWTIERLAKIQEKTPFFYWIHYVDPHSPYGAPDSPDYFVGDRYYDLEKKVTLKESPLDLMPIPPGLSAYEENRREEINRPSVGSTRLGVISEKNEFLDHYVALYDGEIRFVDRHIGMVIDRLEEEGMLENSIIVLWADHGESLGEHNYFFNHGRFPYNMNLKVPLMIYDADYPSQELNRAVSLLDVTPTLLDLAEIDHPVEFEGRSLAGDIQGQDPGTRDVFAESGYAVKFQKILLRDNWKLIYIPDVLDRSLMHGSEFELYNLADDPDELRNVSEDYPEIFADMKGALLGWIGTWEDDMVERNDVKVEYSEEAMQELRALGYVN